MTGGIRRLVPNRRHDLSGAFRALLTAYTSPGISKRIWPRPGGIRGSGGPLAAPARIGIGVAAARIRRQHLANSLAEQPCKTRQARAGAAWRQTSVTNCSRCGLPDTV